MGSFRKATKSQAKLRAAMFGPSGSGKTFTALRIASGLGGSVALIDSERGSASMYADRFEFDVAELGGKTIDDYCSFIREAGTAGYSILIIDSLSHAWQELLEEIDRVASTKFRGNTWSAWSEGTPKQKRLVDAILSYPGHVIATMRSKTEWKTSDGGGGKARPERIGLAPEQGKGIEYEFDLLMEISPDHYGTITKDRTGRYQDKILEKPGEAFGRELAAWLSETTPSGPQWPSPEPPAPPRPVPEPPVEDTPPASRLSWSSYIADRADQAKKHWQSEMVIAQVDPVLRQHPDYQMPNAYAATNHFVTHAIQSGAIADESVAQDGKPGKRDREKAKAAMAMLFEKAPRRIRAAVDAYYAERERELRVKLGMDDVIEAVDEPPAVAPEDASQLEPVEAGAREPGSDDE